MPEVSAYFWIIYIYSFESLIWHESNSETYFPVNESLHSSLDLSGKSTSQHSPLNALRIKNPDKLILVNLNVNSFPNKFDELKGLVCGKINILVLTETKLDSSFP